MAPHTRGQSPTLNDYDSEDSMSLLDEQPTLRQLNDRRLAQAINYIASKGGDDSPGTFINRIDAIDEALIQPLSQRGHNYDAALYRRARAMVRETQLEFEEAARGLTSPSLESLRSLTPDSEDEFPEYYTPSVAEALYRGAEEVGGFSKDIPEPVSHAESKVDLERKFKYGGPNNCPEKWAKDVPAALPFPETFQMAHWESLKIDFDLRESNKRLKAEGKIVETNVPFDHPQLEQYKDLPQYDSGSRFKLPMSTDTIQTSINKQGSLKTLIKVVKDFSMGNNLEQQIKKDYVPRLFLEEIAIGPQRTTEIRRAVNTTPTKPRTPVIVSSAPSSSIKPSQSTATLKDSLKTPSKSAGAGPPKTPLSAATIARHEEIAHVKEKARLAKERTDALLKEAREARETARLAAEKAHVANKKSLEAAEKERKIQQAAVLLGSSPVVRKLDRTRKEAIESSGRRQSGVSTAPTTPQSAKSPSKTPTPGKTPTTSPQAVTTPKRPRGRPPKSTVTSSATKPVIASATPSVKTPVKPKRKLSIGDKPYTPEPKKPKRTQTATPSSSVKDKKQVHFSSDNSSDVEEELVPTPTPKSKSKPRKKETPKATKQTPLPTTPSKTNIGKKIVTNSTETTTKISKATIAGQAALKAKTKRVVQEYVDEEEYQRLMEEKRKRLLGDPVQQGSTRGGKMYLKG